MNDHVALITGATGLGDLTGTMTVLVPIGYLGVHTLF